MAQTFSLKRGAPPLASLLFHHSLCEAPGAHWLPERCQRPFSPAPAPKSTCKDVCDTALTSVGASSQSGARERSFASWGRGPRLCGQEANEGQGLALCNPPPSLSELLGCGLKRQAAGGRSNGQVGISAAIRGLVFLPELGHHYFQCDGSL